jgi:hypothetical protein
MDYAVKEGRKRKEIVLWMKQLEGELRCPKWGFKSIVPSWVKRRPNQVRFNSVSRLAKVTRANVSYYLGTLPYLTLSFISITQTFAV